MALSADTNSKKGEMPMEAKDYKDYCIADISSEDVSKISQLEKMISSKSNKDIVLIAYEAVKDENKMS